MGTLFLSYAATDRARARDLADGLGRAGHTVRMDDRLAGDFGWWAGVLAAIQDADAFLFARSASSLASPVCTAERDYAAALGLPILSVRLDPGPDPIAGDEVDFRSADAAAAFRLVGAVAALPGRAPAGWQPPPAPPFERLAGLAHEVVSPVAGRDDQLWLAGRLRDAVEHGDAPDAARELAAIFRSRTDLHPATLARLDQILPPGPEPHGMSAPPGTPDSPGTPTVDGPPGGTLTEQAVRDVAFGKPGLRRRGYDEQSVDEFLDLVEADLRTRRAACAGAAPRGGTVVVNLTPADVKAVAFVRPPFGRRGYDEQDVDLFLDEVEHSFVVLDAELSRRGSPIAKR